MDWDVCMLHEIENDHPLCECPVFMFQKSAADKKSILLLFNRCLICFDAHATEDCQSGYACREPDCPNPTDHSSFLHAVCYSNATRQKCQKHDQSIGGFANRSSSPKIPVISGCEELSTCPEISACPEKCEDPETSVCPDTSLCKKISASLATSQDPDFSTTHPDVFVNSPRLQRISVNAGSEIKQLEPPSSESDDHMKSMVRQLSDGFLNSDKSSGYGEMIELLELVDCSCNVRYRISETSFSMQQSIPVPEEPLPTAGKTSSQDQPVQSSSLAVGKTTKPELFAKEVAQGSGSASVDSLRTQCFTVNAGSGALPAMDTVIEFGSTDRPNDQNRLQFDTKPPPDYQWSNIPYWPLDDVFSCGKIADQNEQFLKWIHEYYSL